PAAGTRARGPWGCGANRAHEVVRHLPAARFEHEAPLPRPSPADERLAREIDDRVRARDSGDERVEAGRHLNEIDVSAEARARALDRSHPRNDAVAVGDETRGQRAAEKSCRSRDEDTHEFVRRFPAV